MPSSKAPVRTRKAPATASPWLYKGKPLLDPPEGAFGFIYRIVNVTTGRAYIGKKQFTFTNRKKVKGRVNRRKVTKASDWLDYWSSSDELREEVKVLGAGRFTREVLRICATKSELTYGEVEHLVKMDVLTSKLPNGKPAYYNRNIMSRWFVREPVVKAK